MEEKMLYQNKNGKIIRLTDRFGNSRHILFDADGNYLRDIPSVFCVGDMPKLFPALAGRNE